MTLMQLLMQRLKIPLQILPIHRLGDTIDSDRLLPIQRFEAGSQVLHRKVVHQRRVSRLRFLTSPSGYPLDSRRRLLSTSGRG
jgi:hypothetical protein